MENLKLVNKITKFNYEYISNHSNSNILLIRTGDNEMDIRLSLERKEGDAVLCYIYAYKNDNDYKLVDCELFSMVNQISKNHFNDLEGLCKLFSDQIVEDLYELFHKNNFSNLDSDKLNFEIFTVDNSKDYTYSNKYNGRYKEFKKKRIPKRVPSNKNDMVDKIIDLISENDTVEIIYRTHNDYLNIDLDAYMILDKFKNIYGFETLQIICGREKDGDIVPIIDIDGTEYQYNYMAPIRDEPLTKTMHIIGNVELSIIDCIEDGIDIINSYLDKVGDKNKRKCKVYTYKEEN